MSLLNVLINELLDGNNLPHCAEISDQHFGMELLNSGIIHPRTALLSQPLRCGYIRPWRNLTRSNSGVSAMESNDNEFKVNLDVQQFRPEELKVKVVDDYLVIDGKHEERSDEHGFVSRQFTRRYKIPDGVDKAALVSNLSSDGVLTLKAPKLVSAENTAREFPITQSNVPAVNSKEHEKKADKLEE